MRTGSQVGNLKSRGWSARLLTGARATPSVVGRTVIVGTHGAGSLEAFDAIDGTARWRAMLPNWVHQDPVSDGLTVVVGFGNNTEIYAGRAPSGVTALDLKTGQRIWTAFEASSVMTSPIISADRVTYVTAAGLARSRRLSDGSLLGTIELPGTMPMAPPVARGDSAVVALDNNGVCLFTTNPLQRLWCVTVPDLLMLGHSAPTMMGDTILISGNVAPRTKEWQHILNRLPFSGPIRRVASSIPSNRDDQHSQRMLALRLRDGSILWQTQQYLATREVVGHTSGTPVVGASRVVVNLPMPNLLVAFDRKTLRQLWSASGGGSRGPALLLDDRIYVGTARGELAVHDARTGARTCAVRIAETFDRAGPVYAFGTMYFASNEGGLIAVPKSELDTCASEAIQSRLAGSPPTSIVPP